MDEAQRVAEETEEDEAAPSTSTTSKDDENLDYDYLLGMSFWHLTLEKKNELLRKKEEKCTELDILKRKSPSDLWTEDLNALLEKVSSNYFYYHLYLLLFDSINKVHKTNMLKSSIL